MGLSGTRTRKRIVVTGGTGFIGYQFLSLIREKHLDSFQPIALARASSNLVRLNRLLDYPSEEDAVVVGDLNDVESLYPCVARADIVVHLAANMDFYPSDGKRLIEENTKATRNLLDACVHESSKSSTRTRFIFVSSTEAIGATGPEPADETHTRNPDGPYSQYKAIAEDMVCQYSDRLDTVIVRPTGVYGPGERFFFYEFMSVVASGLTLVSPGPMSGRVVFTHVEDVVDGLLICATHPNAVGETFNLCSDDSVTYLDLIQTISDLLRYPRPLLYLPPRVGRWAIRLVAPLMNRGKDRVFMFHEDSVRKTMENRVYSNEKLRRLGFRPKYTMLAGVEHTLMHEIHSGGIKREAIPSAIKKCIEVTAAVVFGISRMILGRPRREHVE